MDRPCEHNSFQPELLDLSGAPSYLNLLTELPGLGRFLRTGVDRLAVKGSVEW